MHRKFCAEWCWCGECKETEIRNQHCVSERTAVVQTSSLLYFKICYSCYSYVIHMLFMDVEKEYYRADGEDLCKNWRFMLLE